MYSFNKNKYLLFAMSALYYNTETKKGHWLQIDFKESIYQNSFSAIMLNWCYFTPKRNISWNSYFTSCFKTFVQSIERFNRSFLMKVLIHGDHLVVYILPCMDHPHVCIPGSLIYRKGDSYLLVFGSNSRGRPCDET